MAELNTKQILRASASSFAALIVGLTSFVLIFNLPTNTLYDLIYLSLQVMVSLLILVFIVSFGFNYWKLSVGALGLSFLISGSANFVLLVAGLPTEFELAFAIVDGGLRILIGILLIISSNSELIDTITAGIVISFLSLLMVLIEPIKSFLLGDDLVVSLSKLFIMPANDILLANLGSFIALIVFTLVLIGFVFAKIRGALTASLTTRVSFAMAGLAYSFAISISGLHHGMLLLNVFKNQFLIKVDTVIYYVIMPMFLATFVTVGLLVMILYIAIEGTSYEIETVTKEPRKPKPSKKEEKEEEKAEEEEEKISLEELMKPSKKKEELDLELGLEEFPEIEELEF